MLSFVLVWAQYRVQNQAHSCTGDWTHDSWGIAEFQHVGDIKRTV